jgi:hypothetical protein
MAGPGGGAPRESLSSPDARRQRAHQRPLVARKDAETGGRWAKSRIGPRGGGW